MFQRNSTPILLTVILALFLVVRGSVYGHHLPPGMEDVDEFAGDAAFSTGVWHAWSDASLWIFAVAVGAIGARRRILGLMMVTLAGGMAAGLGLGLVLVRLPMDAPSWVFALAGAVMLIGIGTRGRSVLFVTVSAVVSLWQGVEHSHALTPGGGTLAFALGLMAAAGVAVWFGVAAGYLVYFPRAKPRQVMSSTTI